MSEVLKWTCPKCGKEIRSLYQRQLKANIMFHLEHCELREKRLAEKTKPSKTRKRLQRSRQMP